MKSARIDWLFVRWTSQYILIPRL